VIAYQRTTYIHYVVEARVKDPKTTVLYTDDTKFEASAGTITIAARAQLTQGQGGYRRGLERVSQALRRFGVGRTGDATALRAQPPPHPDRHRGDASHRVTPLAALVALAVGPALGDGPHQVLH
jgi:hypothetical protein